MEEDTQRHSPTLSDSESDGAAVSGYVDDWQSGRDFIQTNLMMLDNESLSDVCFLVGEDKEDIRAHKFMLASRSCVFFAMFCGSVAEVGEIAVTDIDPQIFRDFLRYLYTGVMALTPDNALNLLYCSKKYCTKSMEQEILEYLKTCISIDNACTLLEQAHLYDEEDLQEAVFAVITREATHVLQSETFKKLPYAHIEKILASDDLKADEDIVFKAAVGWAKAECSRKNAEATAGEIRKVLGDALFKIRFSLMPQSVFVDLVGSSGVLTDSEKVKILERYISPGSPVDPFSGRPRDTRPLVYRIQRLVSCLEGSPLSKSSDALFISCDKPVNLLGVLLYAPANVSTGAFSFLQSFLDPNSKPPTKTATFYITVVIRDRSNTRVAIHHEDREVDDSDVQLEVLMTNPALLDHGKKYMLSVLIEGPVKSWGTMNGLTHLTDPGSDATWTFANTMKNRTHEDSLKEGHISGLVYSLFNEV